MSLLLDALRRASAKRDDPLAERLEVGRHAPAAEETSAGPSGTGADSESPDPRMGNARDEDELSLVPEADLSSGSETHPDESAAPAEPASTGAAESGQRERAAAQALLQAGAGQRRGRAASLLGLALGVLVASAALAAGGWLWYMQSQEEVASALGGYRPDPGEVELGANAPAGSSPSAPEPESPANSSQAAQPEQDAASSTDDAPAAAQAADSDSAQETASDASDGSDGTSGADDAGGDDSTATVESTDTDTPPAEPEDQIAQAAAQLAGSGPGSDGAAQSGSAAEPDRGTVSGAGDAATATSTSSQTAAAGGESGAAEPKSGAMRDLVETSEDAAPQRQSARSAAAGRPPRPMIKQADGAPLVEALNTGYRAFNTGDLATAEQAYARARRLAPDNRDALLGAAAVRQRQGATDAARRLYRQVLEAHPRDPYAQAALAALDASAPRRNESTLKMLLRENPNAPALHYALGNIYAAEARWSEARLAYASAAQAAPDDPDYAYNLAVALDHLGRRDAARRAYAQALSLAAGAAADFDPAAVRRRLQQLR